MQAIRRVKREEGSCSLFLFPEKNARALEPQAHLKKEGGIEHADAGKL